MSSSKIFGNLRENREPAGLLTDGDKKNALNVIALIVIFT
jgi:hypothetical protein